MGRMVAMTTMTLVRDNTSIDPNKDPLSVRQLKTIHSFANAELDIHCGPYGCGKTHALNMGIGLFAMTTKPPGGDAVIALVGKTAKSVKSNICNQLAEFFGENFYYDSGKKDGITKDAVLFGHYIRIIGLNDSGAEARIRGLNAYKIYGDEVSTWSEENFDKIQGRLRGKKPDNTEFGFIGSTNPDSPAHWLKARIDKGGVNYVEWKKEDTLWRGAPQYYAKMMEKYKHNDAYVQRYVFGKWTASEGLIYPEFNPKIHIVTDKDLEGVTFKRKDLGIDFGLTNPTAILEVATDTDGSKIVLDEDYLLEAKLTQIVGKIRQRVINNHALLRKIFIDPSAKVLIDELKDEGMRGVTEGDNSVLNGINYVKDLFATDTLYIHERCTNLINELFTYAFSPKEGENVIKKFDHACDALRYVLYSDRG